MRSAFIFATFAAVWLPAIASVGGLNLRLHQLVLPLAALHLVLHPRREVSAGVPYGYHLALLWIAFLVWTCVNAFVVTSGPSGPSSSAFGRVALLAVNLLTYVLAYRFVRRAKDREYVLLTVTVCGAVMAFISVLVFTAYTAGIPLPNQLVFSEGSQELMLRDGVMLAEDVARQYGGPNKATFLAGITLIGIGMTLNRSVRRRRLFAICGVLAVTGVVVGNARGALVGLAVGLLLWLAYLVRLGRIVATARMVATLVVVAAAGIGITLAVFGPDHPVVVAFISRAVQLGDPVAYSTGTVGQRLQLWSLLWQDIVANPVWGYGMDGFRFRYPSNVVVSENFLLEVLHSTGLWGFIPLMLALTGAFYRAWRTAIGRGATEGERTIVMSVTSAFGCVLIGSLTNSIWSGGLFWLMFGLMVGMVESVRARLRAERARRAVETTIELADGSAAA